MRQLPPRECGTKTWRHQPVSVAESHALSALKTKRARIAGEIIQARDLIAGRTEELAILDAMILMFSPDCDPGMIAPIRPARHGLLFAYWELSRLCLDILRQADGPIMLERIVARVIDIKGLPDDGRRRKHVTATVRASLMRTARQERVRPVMDHPDTWWGLVG
jgi:hypothetical protein